jgi:foldase protein PrsA
LLKDEKRGGYMKKIIEVIKKNKKSSIIGGIILGIALISLGTYFLFFHDNTNDDFVLAYVNGEEIVYSDFLVELERQKDHIEARNPSQNIDWGSQQGREAETQLKNELLQNIIAEILVQDAINNSDVTVSEGEIDDFIDEVITNWGGQEAFDNALKENETTVEEIRSDAREVLKREKFFDNLVEDVVVSNEEILSFYDDLVEEEGEENVDELSELEDNIRETLIETKQQEIIDDFWTKLFDEGDIELTSEYQDRHGN